MSLKHFFFDIETTGLNPAKNGIHQISCEIVIDGITKEARDWKVRPNPQAIIEQEALDVAGVTKEQILAYPPMKDIYLQLIHTLSQYVDRYSRTDKFFLAGYNNAAFDNQFLRGFFLQNADNYFGSWFWSNSIDVMVLATQHLLDRRAKMENFKLATVAKELGITMDESKLHDASYDLYLTKAIYEIVTPLNILKESR
jgi:DNA polymerase-3 subunit epsilon